MNKALLILSFALCTIVSAKAQMLEDRKFHEASNYYVNNDLSNALNTVKEGLRQKPGDQKLEDLRKLLEKEKEKQKKDQEKKEQEKKEQQKQEKDQQKKDQEKKDQEKKEDQNKDDQQKKDQDKKDQDKKDQEQKDKEKQEQDKKDGKDKEQKEQKDQDDKKEPEKKEVPPEVAKRLEQMKISEDKARMILEAMKNQETQYLQQNKRKATKSKDRTKPDW
jgi:Ca-activated chloride channel family protein